MDNSTLLYCIHTHLYYILNFHFEKISKYICFESNKARYLIESI